ncbi:MAG: pre-toxin TG domain-containing protein [Lachnospiraceae bacterium]
MGAVKQLDIGGFTERTMSAAGGGSSHVLGMWDTLREVDKAIMAADAALGEAGLEEFSSHGYTSLEAELNREQEAMSVLIAYPSALCSQLYDEVDHDFMVRIKNGALETLSRIKIDEITVENTFDVTTVLHLQEPGGGETEQSDLKKRIGIRDFIGYHPEKIETTSYVVGFTDILHKPQMEDGQTLEEFLFANSEKIDELLYSGEYDNKKYQPVKQFISELGDAMSLGILPLIKAMTGYDFITEEELTGDERVLALAEGIISLVGLGAAAKIGGFTVKTIISLVVIEGAQQAAVSGTMLAFDEMGMSRRTGIAAGIIAGMLTESAGVSLIKKYTAMKKSGMLVTIEESTGIVDGVIEGSGVGIKGGLKSWDDFNSEVLKIGKRKDISDEQKISQLQELFTNSGYKTDINVPGDVQYIKGFDTNGNVIYDWPPKLGFEESSITSVSRGNGLPDTWDRYGYMGGSNFADVPPTGKYAYSERAIPYVENEAAYHTGTFNNSSYFDKIEAIKNNNLDELNSILKSEGLDEVEASYFKNLKNSYDDFIDDAAESVGKNIDATYGLKGNAAAWGDMIGGAEQYVTPLNGTVMSRLGIIE